MKFSVWSLEFVSASIEWSRWLVSCSVLMIVVHVFKPVRNVSSYTTVNIDKWYNFSTTCLYRTKEPVASSCLLVGAPLCLVEALLPRDHLYTPMCNIDVLR